VDGALAQVRSEHGAALGRLRTALCRVLESAHQQQRLRAQTLAASILADYGALPSDPSTCWTDALILAFVPLVSR
jgi:hypothetical protein